MPELAWEALQAAAGTPSPGATQPRSITANSLVTSSPAPGRGTSCQVPRPGPAHPVQQDEKQTEGAGSGFVPTPPPRCLGKRREQTLARRILRSVCCDMFWLKKMKNNLWPHTDMYLEKGGGF